jgi:hypothetical protein
MEDKCEANFDARRLPQSISGLKDSSLAVCTICRVAAKHSRPFGARRATGLAEADPFAIPCFRFPQNLQTKSLLMRLIEGAQLPIGGYTWTICL